MATNNIIKTTEDEDDFEITIALSNEEALQLFAHLEEALDKEPCDNTLKHSIQWIRENLGDDRVDEIVESLESMGGFCDCEVLFNVTEYYDSKKELNSGNDQFNLFKTSNDGKIITKLKDRDAKYDRLIIPNGVLFILNKAFYETQISEAVLPEGIIGIGEEAFGCTELVKINIPKSVETIGKAFLSPYHMLGKSRPKVVLDPDNPHFSIIDDSLVCNETKELICFLNTSEPKEYAIPSGIKSIGICAFSDIENIKIIRIPDSVEKIENEAFCNCTNLEKVFIPASVKKIGKGTNYWDPPFYRWENEDSLTIIAPKGSKAIEYAKKIGLHYIAE